jgi:hypothetical protein
MAPSLTRVRVCILRCTSRTCKSREGPETMYYCLILGSPNLEGQVPLFVSPRNRMAQFSPWALGSLSVLSYDTQGYDGWILISLHTVSVRLNTRVKVILRPTVSRPVYPGSRPPSGAGNPIFISLPCAIFSDICGFHLVGRPPWREDGSVTYPYNYYWALQALSLVGPSPAGLVTISYCLIFDILFRRPLRFAGLLWRYSIRLSQLSGSWSTLYSLGRHYTKNTASNGSSTIACVSAVAITLQ